MKIWTAVAVATAVLAVWWLTASGQPTSEWLVVSDGDIGAGTLRGAIEAANVSDGDDLIRFESRDDDPSSLAIAGVGRRWHHHRCIERSVIGGHRSAGMAGWFVGW